MSTISTSFLSCFFLVIFCDHDVTDFNFLNWFSQFSFNSLGKLYWFKWLSFFKLIILKCQNRKEYYIRREVLQYQHEFAKIVQQIQRYKTVAGNKWQLKKYFQSSI